MEEKIKGILAKNLAELRKAKNITQGSLAAKLNYSDKSISKWENGETAPNIAVLSRIADFYGVTVDYLITEEHGKAEAAAADKNEQSKKYLAMALVVSVVWICATISYSQFKIWLDKNIWTTFIWSVPASALLLIIFNSIWLKRSFSPVLSSVFIWTLLASVHIEFFTYNMWVVYFIGAPCQIAIVIMKQLRRKHS